MSARAWCAGVLLGVALVATAGVADADPGCTEWIDRERLLVFGVLPLGAPAAAAARLRELPGCFVSDDRSEVDCEYVDTDGIAYLFDADGLLRIEARRGEVAASAVLPLGLEPGESRASARARLARLPNGDLRAMLERQADAGEPAWATPTCVRGATGAAGSWYVAFDDDDRLQRIGLRLDAG